MWQRFITWWRRRFSPATEEEVMWKALYLDQNLSLGDRVIALNVTGNETWRLPTCSNRVSPPATPSDIWIMVSDALGADSLTIAPPAGGVIYLNGQSLGLDTSFDMAEGSFAIAVAVSNNAYAVNYKAP